MYVLVPTVLSLKINTFISFSKLLAPGYFYFPGLVINWFTLFVSEFLHEECKLQINFYSLRYKFGLFGKFFRFLKLKWTYLIYFRRL